MREKRTGPLSVAKSLNERSWLTWLVLGLAFAALAGSQIAGAETNPPRNPPEQTDKRPVSPPPAAGTGSQQSGVIRPPTGVDPGMTKPAPDAKDFPMPVVPPPGTPGGNPRVLPK